MLDAMPNDPTNPETSRDGNKLPSCEADEAALAVFWTKGREAWKDVKSATQWVEELRGNCPQEEGLPPAN